MQHSEDLIKMQFWMMQNNSFLKLHNVNANRNLWTDRHSEEYLVPLT